MRRVRATSTSMRGAAEALAVQAKSLLPKGIVAVEGDFKKGDVVSVFRRGSHEYLGKGIVNYNQVGSAENHERKHQPHGSNQPR